MAKRNKSQILLIPKYEITMKTKISNKTYKTNWKEPKDLVQSVVSSNILSLDSSGDFNKKIKKLKNGFYFSKEEIVRRSRYFGELKLKIDIPEPVVNPVFLNDPENIIKSFYPFERKVLNNLLRRSHAQTNVFPTQVTIAQEEGLSRSSVNRAVSTLYNWGLINKFQVNISTSCNYKVSSIFFEDNMRRKLNKYLSSLLFFSLIFLFARGPVLNAQFINYATHKVNINVYKYHRICSSNRKTFSKILREVKLNYKKAYWYNPIFNTIKNLKLTDYDLIYLSCFSTEALIYALGLPLSPGISHRAQIEKLCWEYCSKYKVFPNWKLYGYLKRKKSSSNAAYNPSNSPHNYISQMEPLSNSDPEFTKFLGEVTAKWKMNQKTAPEVLMSEKIESLSKKSGLGAALLSFGAAAAKLNNWNIDESPLK